MSFYTPVGWANDETHPLSQANMKTLDAGIAASGLSLVGTVETDGTTSSVTFSDVPTDFVHLRLVFHAGNTGTESFRVLQVRLNSDSGNNYDTTSTRISRGGVVTGGGGDSEDRAIGGYIGAQRSSGYVDILGSGASGTFANIVGTGGYRNGSSNDDNRTYLTFNRWENTALVTTVAATIAGDNFTNFSQFTLYGYR